MGKKNFVVKNYFGVNLTFSPSIKFNSIQIQSHPNDVHCKLYLVCCLFLVGLATSLCYEPATWVSWWRKEGRKHGFQKYLLHSIQRWAPEICLATRQCVRAKKKI